MTPIEEHRKRKRYFFLLIGGILFAFVLGVSELLRADSSWVNGSGYIYPNTSWSDNIKLNGTVRGIYGYNERFEGQGIGYLNRTMNNSNVTFLYHNRTR